MKEAHREYENILAEHKAIVLDPDDLGPIVEGEVTAVLAFRHLQAISGFSVEEVMKLCDLGGSISKQQWETGEVSIHHNRIPLLALSPAIAFTRAARGQGVADIRSWWFTPPTSRRRITRAQCLRERWGKVNQARYSDYFYDAFLELLYSEAWVMVPQYREMKEHSTQDYRIKHFMSSLCPVEHRQILQR